ncbi:MAG: NUDIX domain-containing protein [Candidatus Micrarchaeota archaeon]
MPKILSEKTTHVGKLFHVKQVKLRFPSGEYLHEYTDSNTRKSAMIVPVDDNGKIILIETYCTAMKKRELMCPVGLIEKSETAAQAARRECQEEIGFLPRTLQHIGAVETSPSYIVHTSELFIGTQLVPSKLEGDEPEEMKIVRVSWKQIAQLIKKKKIQYATTIAALLMAEKILKRNTK